MFAMLPLCSHQKTIMVSEKYIIVRINIILILSIVNRQNMHIDCKYFIVRLYYNSNLKISLTEHSFKSKPKESAQ